MTTDLTVEEWDAQYGRQAGWTRATRTHLYRRANLLRAGRVLDVGSGTGAVTEEIASRTRGQVVGIDLDPMMVAWGMWVWDASGAYFGIPCSNFLGWLLTAGLITAVIRPANLPLSPLLMVYTVIWLLMTAGTAICWGLPGPALAGGLAMGVLTVLGWRAFLKKSD